MRFKVFTLAFLGTLLWWSHDGLLSFLSSTFRQDLDGTTMVDQLVSKNTGEPISEPIVMENRGLTATYQPILKPYAPRIAVPTAHAAVIVDSDSQEILYAEDADEQRQIASLTKLMTAIIVIESIKNPLDPAELKGLSNATGNASVISFPTPIFEKPKAIQLLIISNKPLFLNKEIATNIPKT